MAGVMAVSTGAILVKLCDLDPLTVGAYRLSLALPLFWLAAERVDPGWRGRVKRGQLGLLALSGVMLGLHFATWVASLSYTSVTSSVVLVTTNPIFVGIGSVLLLKEKVSTRLWVGTFIAFGLSGELPTICYVTSVYTVAALTLWLGVLLTSAPTHGFSDRQWILLVMMALIPQGVGHTLLNRSLRALPASMVAVAILGEPVFATLMAVPILKEYPTTTHVAGGVLVMLGVGLAVSAGKRQGALPTS